MSDEEVRQLIRDVAITRQEMSEVKVALLGYDGKSGICSRLTALEASYYKFKRGVLIAVAFLAGSGVLGFGVFEIVKAMAVR
jgi:hypothetical protein